MARRGFRSLSVGAAIFLVVARQGHWTSAPLPRTPKPVARSFFSWFFLLISFGQHTPGRLERERPVTWPVLWRADLRPLTRGKITPPLLSPLPSPSSSCPFFLAKPPFSSFLLFKKSKLSTSTKKKPAPQPKPLNRRIPERENSTRKRHV